MDPERKLPLEVVRPSGAPHASELEQLHEDLASLQAVVGELARFAVEEAEANEKMHRAFRDGFAAIQQVLPIVDELLERVDRLERGRRRRRFF